MTHTDGLPVVKTSKVKRKGGSERRRKDAEENVSVGLRNESLSLSGGKLFF